MKQCLTTESYEVQYHGLHGYKCLTFLQIRSPTCALGCSDVYLTFVFTKTQSMHHAHNFSLAFSATDIATNKILAAATFPSNRDTKKEINIYMLK